MNRVKKGLLALAIFAATAGVAKADMSITGIMGRQYNFGAGLFVAQVTAHINEPAVETLLLPDGTTLSPYSTTVYGDWTVYTFRTSGFPVKKAGEQIISVLTGHGTSAEGAANCAAASGGFFCR